jgi:glycosyltransferase involved in cell wall biosynthesis
VTDNAQPVDPRSVAAATGLSQLVPLVSVLIPAYNAAATIETTLLSVVAQTYRNLEIIVVDDGSIDDTSVVVRKMAERDNRIRLLRKANAGLAAARNTGIDCARGAFVAPIDADDLWHPTKLQKQVAVMNRGGAQVGAVYCWARAVGVAADIHYDFPCWDFRGNVFAPLILHNFIPSGSILYRRSLAIEIGGYDISLAARGATTCEDLKFNLDLAEHCQFDYVPEFLFGYTRIPRSMSTNTAAMLRSRSIVVKDAFARHPELPSCLFRWATAISARECSRIYLQEGATLSAFALLLRAAAKDPLGAFSPDVARIVLGGILARFGLKEIVKTVLRAGRPSMKATRGQNYFEADPREPVDGRATRWRSNRLHYVASLEMARPG